MDKITLLDTSIGSTNRGDDIIMACAKEELEDILKKYFCLTVPTHLSAFSFFECIGRLPDSAQEVYESKFKIVCGTNLLSDRMFHRVNQWDISLANCRPFKNSKASGVCGGGTTLMGVGARYSDTPDFYTKMLWNNVLSHETLHSVRDNKALSLMTKMGFNAVNTGCLTLWKLTPDFCKNIPTTKADNVVFTLTDYNREPKYDKYLVDILQKNYDNIYFWIQGSHDYEYLSSITDVTNIKIIPPTIEAYKTILNSEIDYIGTRLHAGIFAMRHKVRTLILCVDERMNAVSENIDGNTIARTKYGCLPDIINSSWETKVSLDWSAIKKWKDQFI